MDSLVICIQFLFLPVDLKQFCNLAAKVDSYIFMAFVIFFLFFFFFFIFRFLNRIATVEHIKDYKYRALLSWSLGSFKYKLHLKGIHFVGLGSLWASNCLFLLLFSTSSSPADVPRCCSKRQNEIASNLSSDLIVRDHSL